MGFPIRDSDMTFKWQGRNYYLNLILLHNMCKKLCQFKGS